MATVSTTLPADGQTIEAADVNIPINAILSEFNGNIDDNNIKTGANINGAKIAAGTLPGTALDSTVAGGWISGLTAPTSVVNNGNRSYTLTYASSIAAFTSVGMRKRFTRTVTAPTQCADLESGSSQYFSSTSPAGMTFTDEFTVIGWVKPESYTLGGIMARRNVDTEGWSLYMLSTGQLSLAGLRIAGNNVDIRSYQSIPLNQWTHVAATLDMSANTGTIYINGVLVPSFVTVTGTATALVQGTTALVVGAGKSAGTDPFDGKIAQAAVFSDDLSAATIRSYMSQGLVGTETSLVSAFSCSNSLLDLNTTNNNDLTANGGALMTNADSPFADASNTSSSYTDGTTEFGIVTSVSTDGLTETIQVPEGCALPTSGGISAVAYSTQKVPYGFPSASNKWQLDVLGRTQSSQVAAVGNTWYQIGSLQMSVPVGDWDLGYWVSTQQNGTAGGADVTSTLATTTAAETDTTFTCQVSQNSAIIGALLHKSNKVSLSASTNYFLNSKNQTALAANTLFNRGDTSTTIIRAIPAHL